jgi:hypothetical protein
MAFPQSIIDVQVELDLAGTWTAITGYVKQPIVITRGRPDEATQANPGSAPMMWNNGDGRFTARLATGPYYGLLGRNTPVRVSIPDPVTYLRLENDSDSYATTPDSAGLSITGDTDIRLDMNLSNWAGCTLAQKWTAGGQQSWLLQLNADGTLTFFWSTTGSDTLTAQSAAPVPPGRGCIRATLAVSTATVTFWTAAAGGADGSSWTQLGAVVDAAGSTSVFNSTSAVTVGGTANGRIFEFEIRSGIGGTVKGHPVFTAQAGGATSFADAQSNTWTLGGTAEISSRNYRFHGEAASLPAQWDVTGHDVWTPVACAGLLRRMGQGNAPLDSSMKRGLLQQPGNLFPVAYWPGEDLAGSTSIASATGGPPMTITGTPALAADSSWLCSAPLPTMGTAGFTGAVPAYSDPSSSASVIVRFLLTIPSGSAPANNTVIARVHCTGTVRDLTVYYTTGGGLRLAGWAVDGSNVFDTGPIGFAVLGEQLWVSMELQPVEPSLTHVAYSLVTLQPGAASGLAASGSYLSSSPGNAISVQASPALAMTGCTSGHFSVQSEWESLFNFSEQLNAWQGEPAAARFARLAGENGYQSRIIGYPDVSVAMGAQSPDTLQSLLAECEAADLGQTFEPRQALALGYITQAALLNQAAAVTLDASLGYLDDLGWPTDDDQYSRNDWTVTRGSGAVSGSSFQAVLDDGSPMSISPPEDGGIGDYSDTATVNVQYDAMLPDQGWWRVHLGTADEGRYPLITVDLANTALGATLTGQVRDADIAAYLAIANPPAWLPPDLIKQLATGTVELLGDFVWRISWNAIPESPYETGVYDDAVYGRCDTDGSTLHTGITSSATSMSVATATAGSPLWTTAAADFPLNVIMGGEVMTISGITGTSSPQTFAISARSVNGVVKAQTAGQDVRLYPAPVFAMI